jgi:hypothetical protein
MNINTWLSIKEVQILVTSHTSQSFTYYIDVSSPDTRDEKIDEDSAV